MFKGEDHNSGLNSKLKMKPQQNIL